MYRYSSLSNSLDPLKSISLSISKNIITQIEYCLFENNLLTLCSDGSLYRIPFNELTYVDQTCNIDRVDLQRYKIDLFSGTRMVHFKILDDQSKVLCFSQTAQITKRKNNATFFYDQCWILDLTFRLIDKVIINANGNIFFDTVGTDFNGEKCVSVFFPLEKVGLGYEVRMQYFEENKTRNKPHELFRYGVYKYNKASIESNDPLSTNITSVCFFYKQSQISRDFVIISEYNGKIHLLELSFSKHFSSGLHHLDTYSRLASIDDKKDLLFQKDFCVQVIKSIDHKYAIIRTQLSKLIILEINQKHGSLKEVKFIKPKFHLRHMSLSGSGRFLLIGGMFLESIIRLDLADVDKQSFGTQGVFELNKRFSIFGRKDDENKHDIQDSLWLLHFGSHKVMNKFLLTKNKINQGRMDDLWKRQIKEQKDILKRNKYK